MPEFWCASSTTGVGLGIVGMTLQVGGGVRQQPGIMPGPQQGRDQQEQQGECAQTLFHCMIPTLNEAKSACPHMQYQAMNQGVIWFPGDAGGRP